MGIGPYSDYFCLKQIKAHSSQKFKKNCKFSKSVSFYTKIKAFESKKGFETVLCRSHSRREVEVRFPSNSNI
jgi:hypothetical protein